MSAQSIRESYHRNVETLRKCQLAYDRRQPDEYYEKENFDDYEEVIEEEEDE